jgi:hypothetical protein
VFPAVAETELGVAGTELGAAETLAWPEQPTANGRNINKIDPNIHLGRARMGLTPGQPHREWRTGSKRMDSRRRGQLHAGTVFGPVPDTGQMCLIGQAVAVKYLIRKQIQANEDAWKGTDGGHLGRGENRTDSDSVGRCR